MFHWALYFIYCITLYSIFCVTGNDVDDQCSISGRSNYFPVPISSRPAMGPTQIPIQVVTTVVSHGVELLDAGRSFTFTPAIRPRSA
jgi:hypothetical protein